jgi:two-component system sensor histidine kinase ChvG
LGRLDALVTSARDIEQATADAVYPERKLLNVSDFLKRLIAGHEVALSLQGKRLSAHIDDGITAYANEDLMETAIENLLDNAASYTKEGQTVEVRLARRDDLACITVADRGPGVDAEVIPRIFDRYVSNRPIPRDATMPVGSTGQHAGLGLWIVKRNIEGLGGTVAGRNREEGGFEVVVCLRNQV